MFREVYRNDYQYSIKVPICVVYSMDRDTPTKDCINSYFYFPIPKS